LGKDPEVRFTANGRALARFSLATTERWTDQDGNKQERTEWHNIVVWGKQAETCGQYLSKGRQVFIEGSIRSRQYEDKDGNKRSITEIVARDVRFLGGGRAPQEAAVSAPLGEDAVATPAEEDDIPF
jgi:single-strand DNA-binding protein